MNTIKHLVLGITPEEAAGDGAVQALLKDIQGADTNNARQYALEKLRGVSLENQKVK